VKIYSPLVNVWRFKISVFLREVTSEQAPDKQNYLEAERDNNKKKVW